ncbi:MarR family transcriptional regulator [Sphingomonas sp. MG17]|uniref:MarR family transcriptional regulator n=1 Tax=Sphingomonas tagetis TaxID=2949092 RepID=A0A9X2HJN5_9SPHN|nr:MarR family transcriptional regulator [Sphingomonas tagetis]MCP3730319.1 MarR family transcriptional regulator [Sphingomonas tagetis]
MTQRAFRLDHFLPYLLNQAAERTGSKFEQVYRDTYGLTRTRWRVISHLGTLGDMTAAAISRSSHTEKTKVSRAVAALEAEGLVLRVPSTVDRRTELLQLTDAGRSLFVSLSAEADRFDQELRTALGTDIAARLEQTLRQLAVDALPKLPDK